MRAPLSLFQPFWIDRQPDWKRLPLYEAFRWGGGDAAGENPTGVVLSEAE